MRNASFVALVLVLALAASGCSSLLPKRASQSGQVGEITGTVKGSTPWEQIDSIITIVNNARTPKEKALLQVSGIGVPLNIKTPNRGVTFVAAYYVHVLDVPGKSPGAYDGGAVTNANLESFRRIILGLLKLSFANLATSHVSITIFWPDGVITAFGVPKSHWEAFAAGNVPVEQFLADHSLRMPLGQVVNIIASLLGAGVDPDEFLNFALQLFIAAQETQKPAPPKKKP